MFSEVEAVIFDQGGVLSRGGEKGANENAAARAMGLGGTIDVPDLIEDLKRGRIDNTQYVEGVNLRYPNAPVRLTDAMWDDVYASLKPEPLAYDLVRRCRESGRRVGLLSNINPAMAKRLRSDGSYQMFDPLVLSCYVGYAKPDPEIYAAVEAGLPGIERGKILLLDDQEKCVAGARSRGWQALKVTSPERMVDEVNTLLGLR
ncbi:MAG TPA: HAD family hydrolase [Candidatus Saccharimonadales bacterium]|nr:HAD family hydrolase [Candidatus Saccharimonadales bacterium]